VECDFVAPAAFTVLPGKALAATSANTAVNATEPANSQRLTRLNLRRAASLVLVGLIGIAQWWWIGMGLWRSTGLVVDGACVIDGLVVVAGHR
jgi:hypothetical protein